MNCIYVLIQQGNLTYKQTINKSIEWDTQRIILITINIIIKIQCKRGSVSFISNNRTMPVKWK